MGKFKEFTFNHLQAQIQDNEQESRKDWLLWMFKKTALKSNNIMGRELLQLDNKPIELESSGVIDRKVDYIHNNPVLSGFVSEPWQYSCAVNYGGGKGVFEIDLI